MSDTACRQAPPADDDPGAQPDAVRVRQEWLDIPTTPRPADSPYPAFGWTDWRSLYPYTVQTDVSAEPVPARHRAVILENRYLRATILPDLGGRLFSLHDKLAGQDAFMVPPSLKFQNVSSRGAWLAGGIEFNFGRRGHTVFTVNPVTWAVRTEPDGSAAVWVGSAVSPIESRWALRISLAPARAALDLDINTMGPPVLPGMMYWWSNAGVEVSAKSRFYYFGLHADAMHSRHGWPISDGLDFSWYWNRWTEADMFLLEPQRDYLGFYDFGRRHGLAQTADRFQAPGQKYFTWGTAHQGRFWDLMFSDTEQTYVEIQRGRLPTQAVTEPIEPMTRESWRESWMPIRETDGFDAAEGDLVLSVAPAGESAATVHLLAVRALANLRAEAFAGEDLLAAWDIEAVTPESPFSATVEAPAGRECDRVRVTGPDGRVRMDWTRFHYRDEDWYTEPERRFRRMRSADDDAEGLSDGELLDLIEKARFGMWPAASSYVSKLQDKLLARDPGNPALRRSLAEQALHAGRTREAIEHLTAGLERAPRDPALQLLLGWARLAEGEIGKATDAFREAGRYESARRNALASLACAHLAGGDVEAALEATAAILAVIPGDRWGRAIRVTALRHAGEEKQAAELLEQLLADDPLWPRLHAEAMLLGVEVDLADGKRRLGDDTLSAAMGYVELGLWEDAARILEVDESNEPYSPAGRLAHLAYVHRKLGDDASADAAVAEMRAAPVELAHPAHTASIAVLAELAEAYPDEPLIHLMLGNILASRKRCEEAEAAWRRAAEAGMDHPVLLRNLATAAAYRGDHEAAADLYRRAWRGSDKDLYLFTEIDQYLESRGLHAERLAVYEDLPEASRDHSAAAMRRTVQLMDNSKWDEAVEEFTVRTFLRGEHETGVHRRYTEALIGKACPRIAAGALDEAREILAKGLEYPRNLNSGRHGIRPDEAPVRYLLGVVAEMAGDEAAATEHFQAAVTELHTDASPAQAYEMLAWMAMGRRDRGMDLAHRMEMMARGERPVSPLAFWLHGRGVLKLIHGMAQLVKGRIAEARSLWSEALAANPGSRWLRMHLDMPDVLLERMSRTPPWPRD